MLSEVRDLALFNLAIDSKLRASDLVAISVDDVFDFRKGSCRVIIIQRRPADPCNSN
jgi:site-specific recombinase XerC